MTYAHMSSKGQIVIPAELREEMHLTPGTKIAIQREGHFLILRPVTPQFINSLRGSTQGAGKEREASHRDDKER
jgi:AbrB family looped-hinge helix DNA binding protein